MPKPRDTVQHSVRVTLTQLDALRILSEQTNRSVAGEIRNAIVEYLSKHQAEIESYATQKQTGA